MAATAWDHLGGVPPTAETFWIDQSKDKQPPERLGEEATQLDSAQALAEIRAAQREDPAPLRDFAEWHLDATQRRCGHAPDVHEIEAEFADGDGRLVYRWLGERTAGHPSVIDLERWLLDWEEAHATTPGPEMAEHNDWFEPDEGEAHLLFLPTSSSAESLAYLEFWAEDGVAGASTARLVAILRSWNERFGAELIAHWGTMLQFNVANPPDTLDAAWEIATEIDLIAPSTNELPGIVVRDAARTLWRRRTWFLHERP